MMRHLSGLFFFYGEVNRWAGLLLYSSPSSHLLLVKVERNLHLSTEAVKRKAADFITALICPVIQQVSNIDFHKT